MDYIEKLLNMFPIFNQNSSNDFKKPDGYKNVNSTQLLKQNN